MLARPHEPQIETVNDMDCYLSNFWRSIKFDAAAVAEYADNPVNEADLHARHVWLVNQHEFREKLKTDPDYFDPRIAGWWVWGRCTWIAGGWCDSTKAEDVYRKMPNIASWSATGVGVNRMPRSIPNMVREGVHSAGMRENILTHMQQLADRLRFVRVACGGWERVCTKAVTDGLGLTAVVLDPPYTDDLSTGIYTHSDPRTANACAKWAVENGNNPLLRIALCGYEGQYRSIPSTWECVPWKAVGGYGNQREDGSNTNNTRERIWFSPHCLKVDSSLFSFEEEQESV